MFGPFNRWQDFCEHDRREVDAAIAAITHDPWIGQPTGHYTPSQTYTYRCFQSGRLITYEVDSSRARC